MKNKKKTLKKSAIKATKRTVNLKKKIIKNLDTNITESLKKKVFPYIVNDIIKALHSAKIGQSIRLGKLGRIKKGLRKGKFNGKPYKVYSYSFKAYSALKNN